MNRKKLRMLIILVLVIVGVVLISGCVYREIGAVKTETQIQIIENITSKEAYALIQKNKENPHFVIFDVRIAKEFANEHIENAVNLDYYSEIFKDKIGNLDKNKMYLIYCKSGNCSGNALNIMKELDFMKVYNILGGINEWKEEGLPTTK